MVNKKEMSRTNVSVVDDDRDILEIIEYEFINDREYNFGFFPNMWGKIPYTTANFR